MKFLEKLYFYNFWGLAITLTIVLLFSDRPMETNDWIELVIFLFIPLAAPIGWFFVKLLPQGMSVSTTSEGESDKNRDINEDESLTSNSVSKAGLLGLALGAVAYSKAKKLANPPTVWFQDCPLGGHAEVVSVVPNGKRWLVTARVRQHHMPIYSTVNFEIGNNSSGYSLGSIHFGIKPSK